MSTDETVRLNRPSAAKFLGLSVGTLRNYHKEEKLIPEWNAEVGQWEYPLAQLHGFASVNVLLCEKGEWKASPDPA